MESWRLIEDHQWTGTQNMAADHVLLRHFQPGSSPILRLYTWDCITLSVGKNQRLDAINQEWCRTQGIPIIRRPTGGQAVLHGNDLTYSIIGDPQDTRFSGGIVQTYQTISQAFVRFFQNLGMTPQLQPHSRAQRVAQASQVCFVVPSSYEILLNNRKIIGSAQRQTATAFLQHGTIPLQDQVPYLAHIFRNTSPEMLYQKTTDLNTAGGLANQSETSLRKTLKSCFAEVFQVAFDETGWTRVEREKIETEASAFRPL